MARWDNLYKVHLATLELELYTVGCPGKGDDIPEVWSAAEKHGQPIHTDGNATMGGSAGAQRVEKKPKHLSCLLILDPNGRENASLYLRVVQADGSASDLKAI